MRRGRLGAVLAILTLVGCAPSKPFRDMVGYVPPTSLPAQPRRTVLRQPPDRVWVALLGYLDNSAFAIDHADVENRLIVARYSGDPEPYIDCGSIVTHEDGALDQIPGSVQDVALNYRIDEKPAILRRALNLDSRIIIRVQAQPPGTVISTDTTYVVTKTVDIEDASGAVKEGSRETVSFGAGNRAEFSKGTSCQPNGSLDRAILRSLPGVVGSSEIERAELPVDPADENLPEEQGRPRDPAGTDRLNAPAPAQPDLVAGTESAREVSAAIVGDNVETDWILPDSGLPRAAQTPSGKITVAPGREGQDPSSAVIAEVQTTVFVPSPRPSLGSRTDRDAPALIAPEPTATTVALPADPEGSFDFALLGDDSSSIVDETTRTLLASLDCQGSEWHFCDLVKVTAPYRKLNIERLFGLTINTVDSFTSQPIGSDLKLEVELPRFPAYLHVAYVRRDGSVEPVSTSPERWPAGRTQRIEQSGHTVPGPTGIAMIIAFASQEPLLAPSGSTREEAGSYLGRLKHRLDELNQSTIEPEIAASQLLINVE